MLYNTWRIPAVVLLTGALASCSQSGGGQVAEPPTTLTTAAPSASASPTPTPAPPTLRPKAAEQKPAAFTARISKIPARSTVKYSWRPGCPVPLSGLRLIRMTYWGFDKKAHSGEMIVNADVATDVVGVFRKLHGQRFPIRRMRLVDAYQGSDFDSIEANNTSAFNCRKATGSSSWSQHAYGLAIDINPCENPYVTASGHVSHRDCVKYRDRSRRDPGLIHKNDKIVRAFASIGWGWGGVWSGTKDYQHFSATGR